MEEWNYLEQITESRDYITLNKAIENYLSEIPDNTIDVNNIPFYISIRSDLLPKIIELVKKFMEEYNLKMIFLGQIQFIYGEEED